MAVTPGMGICTLPNACAPVTLFFLPKSPLKPQTWRKSMRQGWQVRGRQAGRRLRIREGQTQKQTGAPRVKQPAGGCGGSVRPAAGRLWLV